MIATKDCSPPSTVDNIRAELNLPAPSLHTLKFLRAILGLDTSEKHTPVRTATKEAPNRPTRARAPAQSAPKRCRNTQPKVHIHESSGERSPRLSSADRRKIATEVFNSTLKQLGQAAKTEQAASKSRIIGTTPLRPPNVQLALHERSPNRESKKNGGPAKKAAAATAQSETPDWRIVADVSHCALHYLQEIDGKDQAQPRANEQGLENAALILLDRTITLNLVAEAQRQLAEIHQRHLGKKTVKVGTSTQETNIAHHLLARPDAADDASTFGFATSMQSQGLRLVLLMGPKAITKELLLALQLETIGGPAWMSVQGLQKGLHNSEQAGLQLRTVSLALSKLYSLGLKSISQVGAPNVLFDLFCLALRLKFESWTRLGHSPEPDAEVWRHFDVAIKRLFTTTTSAPLPLASVIRHLRLFQRLLSLAGCRDPIPQALLETLVQLTQSLPPESEMLLIMEDQIGIADTVTSLILSCYSTVCRLRLLAQDLDATFSAVERTTKSFATMPTLSAANLQRILLYTAYLRKEALAAMMSIERKEAGRGENETTKRLQTAIVNLAYVSSGVLCQQIQAALLNLGSEPGNRKPEAFLTTLVKNIEAVLMTEKCAVTQTPELAGASCDALRSCSAVIDFLLTDVSELLSTSTIRAAVIQLNVRLSNIYWVRYLKLVQQRKPPTEQAPLLELSVKGLLQLPMVDQKSAYVSLKYERLAACYMEVGDHATARSRLQKALDYNVRDGTLNEVVELLLTGHFHSAWSRPVSSCKSLGRNLIMHTRLSLDMSSASSSHEIFYDDLSLPPIHRAALLEKQIYAMTEKDMTDHQLSFWKAQVEFVFNLIDQPQYCVYRLKFANTLLHSALRKKVSASTFLAEITKGCLMLGPADKVDGNALVHAFEPASRSLFALQYGFLTGRITKPALERTVKQISDILRPCRTLEDAEQRLGDIECAIFTLQLSVDYAGAFDSPETAIDALETLYHTAGLATESTGLSRISILIQLGKAYHSVENIHSAGKAFVKAEQMLLSEEPHGHLEVELALAYSEHYLDIGNVEQCINWLDRAGRAWDSQHGTEGPSSSRSRLKQQNTLCMAANLASRLAFRRGQLPEATICGRQAAKIAGVLWLSIEKALQSDNVTTQMVSADEDIESLTVGVSKLNLSRECPQLKAKAIAFQSQITLYCSVFSHLAALNAHCGLYQSAVWFYEEALRVARKAGRSSLEPKLLSDISLLHARAGQIAKAQKGLTCLSAQPHEYTTQLNQALICVNQADTHLLLGDLSSADRCFVEAQGLLNRDAVRSKTTDVDNGPKRTSRTMAKAPARKPTVKSRAKSTAAPAKPKEADTGSSPATMELQRVKESIHFLEAKLRWFKCPRDNNDAIDYNSTVDTDHLNARKSMIDALRLVQTALKLFSEDADNNVLAETAMALPVRYKSARKSGRVSFVQGRPIPVKASKPTGTSKKQSQKRADESITKDGKTLLLQAYNILAAVKDCPQSQISSDIVHSIHKTLAEISLLSTALGHPFVTSSLELVLDKLSPMDLARNRERLITLSEHATAESNEIQSWPRLSAEQVVQDDGHSSIDLDLLPPSWSIVCLGLNEDRSELLVSRINTGRSPFIVRIPLTRPDGSDMEIEDLDFESAKAELQDIIAKANSSAHDPRGCSTDKSLRRAWYDERKALDQHLATLLENIENIWFGGFRGLLSAVSTDEIALKKFGQSFSMTLDRHLPSRRKSSKADVKVELHSHVLELFLTLRHPQEAELEDAITDLLYFVVDILQFNGERNAYDEIDFDAMVVEVLDALHAYHDEQSKATRTKPSSHVILVVDKELQVFPWESLSCLRGRSASRMPSLGAVWERLQAIHQQSNRRDGYVIPATEGTYILNPSSDLMSTQDLFGTVFETQLSQFKAITKRAPQEKEFEEALHDRSLMLYFGHGGGAQYIRGCKIRKMDKCAVTLLMGCSSAKLTECGVYEPYGMPWNYLNGGSPAVVGNLWDVTDRDIDRFAMKLMNEWGLIEADERASGVSATESKGKAPSKTGQGKTEREKRSGQTRGVVSLDQAVAEARDECLLRYLNGAAPVMYGIPVFLE
ncbi:hypothetical protein A1O1_05149 [Capronia coronata CBS 617.96]|uniref:separase n=1 Tax=Capronia coronata CBS 617.96 TaxID=1182541 RepID=W9Z115_9EURO|nr:uncharacterized protein A1O1_05149 [Capronia coronata CBS 617.96]EXJ88219.1 hypothetical protein A1O1_05149 [Capronia coronata CBS 617.96]